MKKLSVADNIKEDGRMLIQLINATLPFSRLPTTGTQSLAFYLTTLHLILNCIFRVSVVLGRALSLMGYSLYMYSIRPQLPQTLQGYFNNDKTPY